MLARIFLGLLFLAAGTFLSNKMLLEFIALVTVWIQIPMINFFSFFCVLPTKTR